MSPTFLVKITDTEKEKHNIRDARTAQIQFSFYNISGLPGIYLNTTIHEHMACLGEG